ncbi:tyrosine-protein kinase Src64B [Lepeophtheirus salmonis]|uniref:tyrosine-protein kinase Src64B n=1 Tax=Lepeophtheirus salmonis TaxID=72036 RepID=UPI001AE45DA0|nr:tyrosine-protein kinase Src64B-like [Lepeophtheirus salmonis]
MGNGKSKEKSSCGGNPNGFPYVNDYRPDPTRVGGGVDRIRSAHEDLHPQLRNGNVSSGGSVGQSPSHGASSIAPFINGTRPTIRGQVVIALYTYQGSECGDMSFKKGDQMEILDDTDPDWWVARHMVTGEKGHIPRNYVAFQSSIESEEWYFGKISRREAEEYLMSHTNARGTFLLRESEQNPGGFALSIKDWDQERSYHVKHYKIKPLDNGRGFFITTRQTFNSLQDLVKGYQSVMCKGLCCQLTKPCSKPQPRDGRSNALEYVTRDQYEIPRSQITLTKKLGAGNFGEVWKGTWQGRVEVAVKTLKPNTMSPEAFLQEAEIMKKFSHPHLVAMYAVCTDQEPFYIITEFMCNGALLDFLRKEDGKGKLTFDNLISISAQVAKGMSHLERKGLIHRDLAARNVLIGENLIAKVADFGLARVIVDNEYSAHQGARFPVKWTAPEAISFGKFTVKSDVWSFGILLMEVFTYGQVPYPGMNNREVIDQVERGYRMAQPTNATYPESKTLPKEVAIAQANVYKITLECWNRDPFKRPTFEFLAHMFEDFNITTQNQYME